jgi:hypothetical protein
MTAQLSSICSIMTTSQLLSARSRRCCGKPCGFIYSWVVADSHKVKPSGVGNIASAGLLSLPMQQLRPQISCMLKNRLPHGDVCRKAAGNLRGAGFLIWHCIDSCLDLSVRCAVQAGRLHLQAWVVLKQRDEVVAVADQVLRPCCAGRCK